MAVYLSQNPSDINLLNQSQIELVSKKLLDATIQNPAIASLEELMRNVSPKKRSRVVAVSCPNTGFISRRPKKRVYKLANGYIIK